MKTTRKITYPAFALFAFACFAVSPTARAICQQGCDTSNANTFLGDDALVNNTTGFANTAVGASALFSNTTGEHNTAVGISTLQNNTTGSDNAANGFDALHNNTIGLNNTANGSGALSLNTTGSSNTAQGMDALFSNVTGLLNTATGALALVNNTIGSDNTANGADSLLSNTTGSDNTAIGVDALFNNGHGSNNTAIGVDALQSNRRGNFNTAIGVNALSSNTTGTNNIALGQAAGANLTIGNENIDIGNGGVAGETKTIRIGATQRATFMAGISGVTVPTGIAVLIDNTGHLGTTTSSERFKDDINPMDTMSEAILTLKPVTFHYKKEIDPDRTPQFGLVAEEVEKVNPDLVGRDEQGKPYTVRYEAVNAMLLNEFLKEHREVQEQKATIVELRSALAQQQKDFQATAAHQQKEIEALTAGLQKVSAELETSKPAPRTAQNSSVRRTAH